MSQSSTAQRVTLPTSWVYLIKIHETLYIQRIPQKTRNKIDIPKGHSVIETQISPNINSKYYIRSAMPYARGEVNAALYVSLKIKAVGPFTTNAYPNSFSVTQLTQNRGTHIKSSIILIYYIPIR